MNLKNTVRKEIKLKRENLSLEEKVRLSTKITENFFKNFEKKLEKAEVIMSYMDFKNEVMTNKLNEKLKSMEKKIVLPKVLEDKSRIIPIAVSYTHLTLPTTPVACRSRWSPYH